MTENDKNLFNGLGQFFKGLAWLTITAAILTALWMWFYPQYKVYQQTLSGEATLKEAESSRKVAVEEAKAKLESAKLLADAEVERAKGVDKANKIIGEGLKGHGEYLTYLWIQSLDNHATIYIPTEANLPILEANRFNMDRRVEPEAAPKK